MIIDFRLKVQADIKSKYVVTSRRTWLTFDFRLIRSVKADKA